MTAKFQKLKEELKSLESGDMLSRQVAPKNNSGRLYKLGISSPKWLKGILLTSFLGMFLLYAGITYIGTPSSISNPFTTVENWANQPDEELLTGMGNWMEEMGYTGLSREDLIDLRQEGVTATYTSRIRDLGYTDVTLDEIVRMRQNDVSATFAAMMKELGYELTTADLVELRQHDVTAYFTSNMHDLGYSDITTEELIRLKDTGVTADEARQLIEERGEAPSIEELIRYHISNQ